MQILSIPARRPGAPVVLLAVVLLAACEPGHARDSTPRRTVTDSLVEVARARLDTLAQQDSALSVRSFTARPRGRTLKDLPHDAGPMADSLAAAMVFAPATQTSYLAAVRAKRLLVDIGRVHLDVKKSPERLAALRTVAAATSPVAPTASFRLRGAWGTTVAPVAGYDAWNGRLVAVLALPPALDSLVRATPTLVASAELLESWGPGDAARADSIAADAVARDSVTRDSLARVATAPRVRCDSVAPALLARADSLRDSVLVALRATPPRLARLAEGLTDATARAVGCFGGGRVLLFAGVRAGGAEYVQERVLMLDTLGRATPFAVRDFRFKTHDQLRVLDADGDGIDDVAALAGGRGTGGTVILRVDPAAKRLERLTSGFAW